MLKSFIHYKENKNRNHQLYDGYVIYPVKMRLPNTEFYKPNYFLLMDRFDATYRDDLIGHRMIYFNYNKMQFDTDRVKYHIISMHPSKIEVPKDHDFAQEGGNKKLDFSVQARSSIRNSFAKAEMNYSSGDNEEKHMLDLADDEVSEFDFSTWMTRLYSFEFMSEESF